MAKVNTEGIPKIEAMVMSSGITETNNNKFIIISEDVLVMILKIRHPPGIVRARSIYNRFDKYSFCKAVLIYQRMFRKDNQAAAKELLGTSFSFTTDLYNTLSSLKDDCRHRGNSSPLYIIYDDTYKNFDMKSALNILNQSIVSYFNKENISTAVKNLVELAYPLYESWRWKTKKEINLAKYMHKYYKKRNKPRNCESTSDEKLLDNIKEMCNNYFKALIDHNDYEKVENSFLEIYEVMDMNRKEARYNRRHNINQ